MVTDSWRSSGEQGEHNVFIWQHGLPHNSAFCSLWCSGLPATYLCLLLSLRFLVSLLMFPAFLMPDFCLALGVWYASLSPNQKRHSLALDWALTLAFIQLLFSSWPPLFFGTFADVCFRLSAPFLWMNFAQFRTDVDLDSEMNCFNFGNRKVKVLAIIQQNRNGDY